MYFYQASTDGYLSYSEFQYCKSAVMTIFLELCGINT